MKASPASNVSVRHSPPGPRSSTLDASHIAVDDHVRGERYRGAVGRALIDKIVRSSASRENFRDDARLFDHRSVTRDFFAHDAGIGIVDRAGEYRLPSPSRFR